MVANWGFSGFTYPAGALPETDNAPSREWNAGPVVGGAYAGAVPTIPATELAPASTAPARPDNPMAQMGNALAGIQSGQVQANSEWQRAAANANSMVQSATPAAAARAAQENRQANQNVQNPAQQQPDVVQDAATQVETANQQIQDLIQQQMANLDQQYQLRSDSITQGGIAQMRQAAGIAGLAGQSFGGSFADTQRQVGLSTEQLQNQAFNDYLGAQNDILGREQQFLFQDDQARQTRDFQRELVDLSNTRQDEALAGQIEAEAQTQLQDYALDAGVNPLTGPNGQVLDYNQLDPMVQGIIDDMAAATGQTTTEVLDSMNVNRYTPTGVQMDREAQRTAQEFPVPAQVAGPLDQELAEARSSGAADSGDRKEYAKRFEAAYSAVNAATGMTREEFSQAYQYPLPEVFNYGQNGYYQYG